MSKRHDTRSSTKPKGNENPFAVGGSSKKPNAKSKPVQSGRLDPVRPNDFYGKAAKHGTGSKGSWQANPPSPTNHAAEQSRSTKAKSRAHPEIIDVDPEGSDDAIEDSHDMIQMSSPRNPRASMQIAGKGRSRQEDEEELVHIGTQGLAPPATTKHTAMRPRIAGGKSTMVSIALASRILVSIILTCNLNRNLEPKRLAILDPRTILEQSPCCA